MLVKDGGERARKERAMNKKGEEERGEYVRKNEEMACC